MDRDDDVERLFSWIKTPDIHYREFSAEREVADAAARWPAPRDAVTEPSHPGEPHPPAPREGENRSVGRMPLGERLTSLFGHRQPPQAAAAQPQEAPPVPPPGPEEAAGDVPWAPEPPRRPPILARREPAPPEPEPQPPAREYRGFEETQTPPPAAEPARPEHQRSLDAIFARVAHPDRASRDERQRRPARPGLGPVFRRLR